MRKRAFVLAVAVGLASALWVPQAAQGPVLQEGSFSATIAGHVMHYEVHGIGPVLMTLPNSWGLSLQGLRGLYRPLEAHFTMVYFDPRGMGLSGPVRAPADMSMAAVREDFEGLREHLGLGKVNAIGWSNGAINLILLASEHPGSLASAVFVHGVPRLSGEDDKAMAASHPDAYRRYEAFFAKMEKARLYPEAAAARLKKFYLTEAFPDMCADPAAARPKIGAAFRDAEFSWAHSVYSQKELPTFDFRPDLPKISTRCLVIAGAHDLLPPERVREIAEGVPGARFVLFEKSGHFSPLEEPDRFEAAVVSFLACPDDAGTVIQERERWALDLWAAGDPRGFLALCEPDVTYFDNVVPERIDGLEKLTAYYSALPGKVHLDRYELLNPRVQVLGPSAALTYNFVAWLGSEESRWNCTEVYARTDRGWRIVSTHWSPTQAVKPKP